MERKSLTAEVRTEIGSGPAGRLRRAGRIPAIVYGHDDPISISINAREFGKAFHTVSESQIVALEVGKDSRDVLIKDYTENILTGEVTHIDFYEVERGRKLRTHIAVDLQGSPVGVRAGGVLEHMLYEVDIECLPKDLPDHLIIDVSELDMNESIHVGDMVVPEGVRIMNAEDQTVCAITSPRAVIEDEEEEEDAASVERVGVALDAESEETSPTED